MMIRLLKFAAALRTTSLPVMLVLIDSSGDSRIVFTPKAAAICRTRSASLVRDSTSSMFLISPSTVVVLPSRCAILVFDPVEKLSRIVTWSPAAT